MNPAVPKFAVMNFAFFRPLGQFFGFPLIPYAPARCVEFFPAVHPQFPVFVQIIIEFFFEEITDKSTDSFPIRGDCKRPEFGLGL